MFKIDFKALNKTEFSNELNSKVLRELCAEARQRVWRQDSSFTFKVYINNSCISTCHCMG